MSSEETLSTWLEAIHLQEYVPTLLSQGYDTIHKCTAIQDKQALKDLGVTKAGHLNRLFRAIEKLRGESSGSSTLPPNVTLSNWTADERKVKSMTLLPTKPPAPPRRSVRRSPTSPVHSRSPTPESEGKPQPPPVMPRTKSLRRVAGTIVVEPSKGGLQGSEAAPITQSPAATLSPRTSGNAVAEPEFVSPSLVPQSSVATEEQSTQVATPPKPAPRKNPPQPKPRTAPVPPRRTSSAEKPTEKTAAPEQVTPPEELITPTETPPVPPKKASSQKPPVVPPEDIVFELEDVPMPSPTTTGFNAVHEDNPPLPPKSSGPPSFSPPPPPPERKYFSTESTDPHSELEPPSSLPQLPPRDPEPLLHTLPPEESSPVPLPPKDSGPPSFSPPPPPPERKYFSTESTDPHSELDLPSSLPQLPPRDPEPLLHTLPPEENPPVPLPPKDSGPPEFSPPPPTDSGPPRFTPPPPSLERKFFEEPSPEPEPPLPDFAPPPLPTKDITVLPSNNLVEEPQNTFPPLPPKESHTPPPPPPITEEDYPQDSPNEFYSDSESEEEGQLMSIRSTRPTDNEDLGLVHPSTGSSSSEEGSPLHQAVIRQQLDGLKSGANAVENDSMMILTPPPPRLDEGDDYMNQEVIDQVMEENEEQDEVRVGPPLTVKGTGALTNDLELKVKNGHDYINSDTIDQVYDEEEHSPGEKRVIHSTSTIRSLKAPELRTDDDYENQEVLDGDIIPLITLPADDSAVPSWTVSALGTDPPPYPGTTSVNSSSIYDTLPPLPAQSNATDSNRSNLSSNRDSISGTFPRTRSDAAAFARDHNRGSLVADTPSGVDSNPSPGSMVDTDFLDGRHLIRTAGTFACGDTQYKRPDYKRTRSDAPSTVQAAAQSTFTTESIYAKSTRYGSETFHHVPKTKEGYLYKKGGRRSERPWQKRWMTFNGSELKYFKNQYDKDRSSRNIVPLHEMIDIKKVHDDEKQHRFDLVVINRVFQFYALSAEESQAWIDVLHAAISKFKPQQQEFREGGNMHNPDRQGFLMKQGHGALNKGFKERYVALKGSKFAYYETKEDFVHGRPIHVLEMSLSSVRPDISSKLPRFIITMNNMKQYVFQASSDLERKEWLDTMTTAILTGLDTRPQTINRGGQNTTSQDILAQVQENPSNRTCADCAATDPSWGVINKGIMVCINCSGVHRSLGTHVSKVRSIELDRQIWKSSLIKLMVDIGNENSNKFWERHYNGDRLPHDVERDIRENFIRAKYEIMSWIPRPTGESQEVLNKLLCVCVKTSNLMRTIELLAHGAKAGGSDDSEESPLSVSREHNQEVQVELLEQNGGLIRRSESSQSAVTPASKKGNLFKTGSDRSGWKRRFCSLDKFRGFEYFKSEGDSEALGNIRVDEMLGVSRCEDESSRDSRYRHCFEVNTQGRGYLFCADTEEDMSDWIRVFEQIIPQDASDNLGFDKVGYLKKKESVGGYKRRWFTLKGKSLSSYRREREEIDEVDLRKVTELKAPDPGGNYEQQCTFTIFLADKVYQLRADTPGEAEAWISALKHTQVSGIPLAQQQLTGTGIPILVHKCLQFVESYGMETEGLYRLSGGKVNCRKLVLAFNQDARGVVIDPEVFTVHDVTGTLKQFFRSLPDPLLTHRLYQSFVNTMQSDHESQMYQLQSLVEELPPVNRETLRRVAGHLKRVAEYEPKNKMSLSNLVRLFAPTLMTVDGDPVSFENTQYEYACIHAMIKHYKWLFQVDEEETKKEEAIEAAMRKIKEADQMQQNKASAISSSMDFLTRVYIGNKDGDSYGINITGTSLVSDVVEKVVTEKALPPNHYALYLVLGDSESHRVLSFSERLLAVLCSTGSDCFLCLKPNTFGETLKQYIDYVKEVEPVMLQIREKKKWKKYPCTVRNDCFIQFKDSKCHHEHFKLGVQDFDVFAGIEGSKIEVKNPLPTRYCFWLKAMRGEDKCRYLCADSEEDMLKIFAWIVKAKYPDQLQTPLLPTIHPPTTQPPVLELNSRASPIIQRKEEMRDYANVKPSGRKR